MSGRLSRKQQRFALMLAEFIVWIFSHEGWAVTMGEGQRGAAQIAWNVAHGIGIARTLHAYRLAQDLNFFINGVYQKDTEAYRPLGEEWERRGGTWGGRFKKPDGNHFSLEHDGIR